MISRVDKNKKQTHLGAYGRRSRAEITGAVERVKRYRPLGIRLPVNGCKVVGGLERIDTLATAGSLRNTRRNVIETSIGFSLGEGKDRQ